MNARWILVFSAGLLLATAALAQQKPCQSPEYRQFDFWIGEWEVSWPASPASGRQAGKGANRVESALGDCVVVENFDGSPGMQLRGMSVSTYDARSRQWKQTWVDNTGGYLDFTGRFQGGEMVLTRRATLPDGKPILQRMVWKNIRPDSFDWSWERSEDKGKTWQVLWPIHYVRKARP
jgi:hypothetical protein